MAAPFVYVPEESSPSPHPFFSTPPANSPFLPPGAVLYPSSPYLAPGTPENSGAHSVLWPESADSQYESPYTGSWAPLSNRQRTTSWHGPAPPPQGSPFLQPSVPAFLQSHGYFPGHRRSTSWGAAGAPPPPSWLNTPGANSNVYAPAVANRPLQVHPFLNGDAPSPIFHFDLAPRQFAPIRLINPNVNPPQTAPLSAAEIREVAFDPPLTTVRILHPRIPFWPVDLALPATAQSPGQGIPISLGDVLVALHRSLHVRISHADWATLAPADAELVTAAFTQRCRAEAVRSGVPRSQLRDREVKEREEGVKRIDFLCGRTAFKGLIRVPEDGEGCVRVVTA